MYNRQCIKHLTYFLFVGLASRFWRAVSPLTAWVYINFRVQVIGLTSAHKIIILNTQNIMTKSFLPKARWLVTITLLLSFCIPHVWADTYALVTDASTLASGDEIIIVNDNATPTKALGTTQNNNNRAAVSITVTNGKITPGADVQIITLGTATISSTTYWTLKVGKNAQSQDQYLYSASNSNNYLRTTTDLQNTGKWSISISSGTATIDAQANRPRMRFNSTLFSCYATNSGTGSLVRIYKKEVSTYTITAQSNNNSYGTVSLTGTTITASPESGYRVSTSTPYTISPANSATVTDNGDNTFSVTPSANTTITINFEAIPTHTLTFSINGGSCATSSVSVAEGATYTPLPTVTGLTSSCEYGTFVGWTTESSTYVHGTSSLYTTSYEMGDANVTLHAVYSKTTGGSSPTAYSAGDTGDFVIASFNTSDEKWYAIPQNPTVSSGKIAGVEITVGESGGVYYVTPANATGYTWNIRLNTNGSCSQSLYDAANSKALYHSNGGTSGTNLSYGTSTGYGWDIDTETNGLTFQGVGISSNTCTTNSRGMLMNGTNFGGYSLTNEDVSGYYRIQVLPIASAGTTTYSLDANCCTALGTINGSVSLSQSGTSLTVSDWTYDPGSTGTTESNVDSYTVNLYNSSDSYTTPVSHTNVSKTTKSTTFDNLTLGETYKIKIIAVGSGDYCNGPETAFDKSKYTGEANYTTRDTYTMGIYVHINNGATLSDWNDYQITTTSTGIGTATIPLSTGVGYGFKIADNSNNWWGNSGTMTSSNCTNWTFDANANAGLTADRTGNYVFTVNYSGANPVVSVTYPSATQDAGNLVYWDASIHGDDWSNLYFRVGTSSDANANASNCKIDGNLVPGTDKFYKIPTVSFTGMDVWAIANNKGWIGSNTNGVYKTKTGDAYAITKSSAYQDYAVTATGVTLIPASSGSTGTQSHDDNCTFYGVTKTDGMLTHNVAVGSADHGTLLVTYTNTSGTTGQTVTEGNNADLAHRCILTITATPENANYEVKTLTVTPSGGSATNISSGDTHILTANATIAATFGLKDATITLNNYSGSATTTGYHVGESFTLPSTNSFTCEDKTFVGWSTVEVATTDTKPSSNFYEPGASVTLAASNTFYAVFATASGGGGGSNEYELVTDASTLSDGDQILIVSPAGTVRSSGVDYDYGAKALSTSVCGTTRLCGEDVTIDGTTITTTTATVFTLSGNSSDGWKIYNGSDYLYADAKNKLSTTTTVGDALVFPITIAASDPYKATIGDVTLGSDACHLDFNPSVSAGVVNPYFALYTGNQKGVYIYKSGGTTYSAYSTSCGTVYALTFKETDGTNNGSGKVVENATSFSYATAPTKAGKQVEGFYAENTLTTKVANGDRTFVANVTNWTGTGGAYTKDDDAVLYLKWEDKVTTITLDKGTGGTSDGTATVTYGTSALTSITHATKTGYSLTGYYTEASGGTKVLNDDGTFAATTVSGYVTGGNWSLDELTCTLYAQWEISNYSIAWIANGVDWTGSTHGSPSTNANYNTQPATIPTAPVSADCDNEKVFVGWTAGEYEHASVAPTMFTTQAASPAITDNTTFYAVFATASGSSTDWSLVTSSSDALADGDDIIIASSGSAGSAYAMGYQDSNNRKAVEVTISAGPVISNPTLAAINTNTTDIYPMKLIKNGDYWNIKDPVNGDYYLASTSGSNARLKRLTDANDEKAMWSISINASGVASVQTKSTEVYRNMRYNSGSTLFASYNTGQQNIYFYRKSVSYADYTTTCCQQPAVPLTMTSDKTELTKSGEVVFTLSGGNGQNITWSCVDEANTNCNSLVSGTNSGATLTILEDVTTTKTYFVTATQPENPGDDGVTCGKVITMEITVKAEWTITFQTTDDGIPTTSEIKVVDGESYTFPDLSEDYSCETDYSFAGWKSTNSAGAPEYAAGSSAVASANTTWYAVWMHSNGTTTETRDKYELITSASTALAENDVVVIASNTQGVALAQMTTDDTYGSPVVVDFASDKSYLTFAAGTTVMPLKLIWNDDDDDDYDGWRFKDNAGDGNLRYGGSAGQLLYDEDKYWMWDITFDASGNATIVDAETGYEDYQFKYKKDVTRFAVYTGSGSTYKSVQLYRKNGTISVDVPNAPTYYVNNTHCDNGPVIRATGGQWVTSANGQTVKAIIPVTAKNFTVSGKQITASSDNEHFAVSVASHTIPGDGSESATINVIVEYTPVSANITENANITLTTGATANDATKEIEIHGRSLPDEFAIVTYKESKWQALPADMFSGAGTYEPILVTPNAGHTQIPAAPYTVIYGARAVADSRYAEAGECIRLVGNSNKCLWANNSAATGNTHIQNWATLGSTNSGQYEWLLTTTDGELYKITNPAHDAIDDPRRIGIYSLKYGLYKTDDLCYILPVGCSSLPGNVQITPHRVDAIFSWGTNASSVTIDLWTNEAMDEGHKQAVVTSVPYEYTGLAENTAYWYKLTPDGNTSCAVTGSFSTTGPTIDLVEWGENSATIFVDIDPAVATDEELAPQIVIAGQHEHGLGGTLATDIFFSKYFEAQEKAKMLAIYNGTGNAISLAEITIVQRANATPLSLAKYGKTAGWIQPGEEIILYYPSAINDIMKCAEEEESYSSWNNVLNEDGSGNLDFGGKGTVRLFRGSTCIDIIGAMESSATAADMNNASVTPMDGATKPSWGDKEGFTTATGDNYSTKETIENNYGLSTNRCLLVRQKWVTSGDSAVMNNFGDFKTLGVYTGVDSEEHRGEWSGLQVPNGPSGDQYKYTCEGFAEVGVFDYDKYYSTYDEIDAQYLTDYTRGEDGTYTIEIDDMQQYACLNLQFQLTAHGDKDEVLTNQYVQVPIVVAGAHTTADAIFNEIVKEDEAPYDPMIAQSIERCKTCNIVVLGTGTLTKAVDGTTNDVAEVGNLKIYPGGKLVVPSGRNYKVNTLAFRRQEDEVSMANIQGGLTIGQTKSVFLDVRIDPSNWHYFTLPYNCRVGDITWSDGSPANVNADYVIGWYDGAYRAEHKTGGWTEVTDNEFVLKQGVGYIVSLPGSGKVKRELRFPMANDVITAEGSNKDVTELHPYGGDKDDETLRPNHKGWNMIGNPYLLTYNNEGAGNIITDPLMVGTLIKYPNETRWNGTWVVDEESVTDNLRYIVEPISNGWRGYRQTTINDLKPFMAYFVQIGGSDPSANRTVTFKTAGVPRSVPRRVVAEEEDNHPVWYGLQLIAPNGEKDNTTLLISDNFTDGYDMMDDLAKQRGSYYNYYPDPVLASQNDEGEMAFNALPDASAAVTGVPLNYYAPAKGSYTFTTDSRFDLTEVKSAMLLDTNDGQYYDMLTENPTFSLAKGNNNGRFKLFVRVERNKPLVPTDVDNLLEDGQLSLIAIDKTLILSGLTDDANVYVYDMSGKLLRGERANGNTGVWRATVPTTGVYFVRVNSAAGQQTLRTIVK